MSQTQFSVSWTAYEKNICKGLSSLQQRGEFVDMTLAADGHLVRVHRMVLSLVSPYIKQLIASADCTHPVIFLNQISYDTLCSILEYIYTGEVHVPRDNLTAFVQAGKALHIKGLEDMDITESNSSNQSHIQQNSGIISPQFTVAKTEMDEEPNTQDLDDSMMDDTLNDDTIEHDSKIDIKVELEEEITPYNRGPASDSLIQYTLSTQGNLQLILNRFMYSLKYMAKSGHRHWQCVNNYYKCPAAVSTKYDKVVQRSGAHNHPYHDAKILKKVRAGSVYATIKNTEIQAKTMKKAKKDSIMFSDPDKNYNSDE